MASATPLISNFTHLKANTLVDRAVPQKIILIDGTRLADLMIEHNIGVTTARTVEVKRIDSDYFEQG